MNFLINFHKNLIQSIYHRLCVDSFFLAIFAMPFTRQQYNPILNTGASNNFPVLILANFHFVNDASSNRQPGRDK